MYWICNTWDVRDAYYAMVIGKILMDKSELLKKYIEIQAEDEAIWFAAETATESYLQSELRRVAWLIEHARDDQIKMEIELYKGRIP